MNDFGVIAKALRVRVVGESKAFPTCVKVPCSMGFRQRDKSFVNEWVSVFLGPESSSLVNNLKKGDMIEASGNMYLSEYKGAKSWCLNAEEVKVLPAAA